MKKELLLKYIDGDATDTEKAEVISWIDSDTENMREYLSLRKLNDITIWQTTTESKSSRETSRVNPFKFWRKSYTEVLKIAAVIAIAFFASYLYFSAKTNVPAYAMQTIYVPAGQRAEITLVDGTKVWLNAKTTFTFPNYFSGNSRNVTLDGEAYFDVTASKEKPFIVKTDQYDVKVWGTKFNLLAYSCKGNFEASLFEGSVEILKPNGSIGVYLLPDERIYQKDHQLIKSSIRDFNRFLWKDGILSFNDESFPELVEKLELYFDLKIDVKNNSILKYRCTGKFRTKDGIDHILKVLQLSNEFNFKIDEKTNAIRIY